MAPDITLLCYFGLGDITVPLDKNRFRRAVINIFENACQAMTGEGKEEAGTGERILTVRTREHNGRVEIVFEDTGPGIPPDVHGRIFEPLFSTKSFGVGLGLPVVKQIMEQHNGGIETEAEEGRGAKICLWLPRGS
jgi:signal transduction histidine kinase